MKIAVAQINFIVGDIRGNCQKMVQAARKAHNNGAEIIVFSELALTGYPPEDLLLRPDLYRLTEQAIDELKDASQQIAIVAGYPARVEQNQSRDTDASAHSALYNCAGFFYQGRQIAEYKKQYLPNYKVFDEKRYFTTGTESCLVEFNGYKLGLLICEDLWHAAPVKALADKDADLVIAPNASPFHIYQLEKRRQTLSQRVEESGLAILYVNQVGGQDELVFDGCSMAINASGHFDYQAKSFDECLDILEWDGQRFVTGEKAISPDSKGDQLATIYEALKLGLKDYVEKNGFKSVLLGLSGGIDSALTLAIAADALGADRVMAVMMPFKYTAQMSVEDAAEQARRMGVEFDILSIEPIYEAFMATLSQQFEGTQVDTTEQNLQARCRGTLLMALSNKRGALVVTTGNKSEVAVGYATLYGDMAGGFDLLKDVAKTRVYQLAEYRNTISPVIPERVITRPPSAELAPDQKDEDNLPDYATLDAILAAYVEEDKSLAEIVALGFIRETVERVIRLVDINEHKRRQAAPGVRITPRAFGRDRRYPITSGYRWQPFDCGAKE